jgi:hypothetical protein
LCILGIANRLGVVHKVVIETLIRKSHHVYCPTYNRRRLHSSYRVLRMVGKLMVRLMLTGYVLIAIAASFHLGNHTHFYSDGILIDTPYITYWFDYDGVAQ